MMKSTIPCAGSTVETRPLRANVRTVCAGSCLLIVMIVTSASGEDRSASARRQSVQTHQPDADPAGIVLRFSERLFDTPEKPEINRVERVRERILGICNVGTSRIVGHLSPDFRPKSDGISMRLKFYGTTTSRTTGQKQLARITSYSTAKFLVETPIVLDMETGFSAGRPTSKAEIVRTCRNVTAKRAGLLAPIVKASARQQVRRQEGLARRETEKTMERRLTSASADRINQRLDQWNEKWQTLQTALQTLNWYREELPVQFATDDSHLILFIDVEPDSPPKKATQQPHVKFPPQQLPEYSPHSVVDVIIYQKDIDRSGVAAVMKLVESIINQQFAKTPKLDRTSIDTRTGDDWVMLSVILEPARDRDSHDKESSSSQVTQTRDGQRLRIEGAARWSATLSKRPKSTRKGVNGTRSGVH